MKTILGQADRVLIFDAVAEECSFTRAAERLGCSKAHVSTQLSLLESHLGVQLVHRTTRQITLTDAGQIYRSYARKIKETLAAGESAVSSTRSDMAGQIRITISTSLGESVLPDLIMAFRLQYPNVEPVIDMSSVHRNLINDGFDVAIRLSSTLEDSYVARPLGFVRDVIVASPSLVRNSPAVEQPDDLVRLPCLLNHHFSDEQHWTFRRDKEHVSVKVSGPVMANTYQGIRRFALLGAGAARLPRYLVEEDIANDRLAMLCDGWEMTALPLHIVYPGQRHLPLRTRMFVDFTVRWFAEPSRHKTFG